MARKRKKRTVLSLFSGCGGMDLGFEGGFEVLRESVNTKINSEWIDKKNKKGRFVRLKETNFQIIYANDIDPCSQIVWVEYFGKRGINPCIFELASIVDVVKGAKNGHRNNLPNRVDLVIGGFPCQDFSVAGKRKGFNSHRNHNGNYLDTYDDPKMENRGTLYIWMKEVIELTKPKVFIAENVKGLLNLENAAKIIESDFKNIGGDGYFVHHRLLNAANYGVPQARERVFFIGIRKSSLKKAALNAFNEKVLPEKYDPFPKPTHNFRNNTSLPSESKKLASAVTVFDALNDLPEPESSSDPSHINYSRAKYYGKHCQGQTEVNLDQPGPTIRSEHHGNIEFRRLSKNHGGVILDELAKGLKERRLSVRECARLQTFPDDYEFVIQGGGGFIISPSSAYKLVGNAVPPLLGYHIARRIDFLWDIYFNS